MNSRMIHRTAGFRSHAAYGRGGGTGMARSRHVWDRRGLLVIFAGLIVLGVLTGQVSLSNGIIQERAAIASLEADRDYLQTSIGLLELAWNRNTAREVIQARAIAELDMTPAAGPPLVLVARPQSRQQDEQPTRGTTGWLNTASAATEVSKP